jgi:dihydroneopterin aldolase
MGFITLNDFKVRVRIGVSEEERAFPTVILLSLAIECDISRAAQSDSIDDAIDYEQVVIQVRALCETAEYRLLERLISEIAQQLLDAHAEITGITISAKKDIFSDVCGVSVSSRFSR